jgi:hypothetical protein
MPERTDQAPDQPSPRGQAAQVITTLAARLNRTPAQPLNQTDLRIRISEVVHQEHKGAHPDQLIPAVRAALPALDAGATCGEYAALLRTAATA